MKLYIPVPSCLKFQKIIDNNEYLQLCLEQDNFTITLWHIDKDADLGELKRILVGNRINYRFEK